MALYSNDYNWNLERIGGLMEENTMVTEVESVVNYEEILEQIYGEMQEQTELLAEIKKEEQSIGEKIL